MSSLNETLKPFVLSIPEDELAGLANRLASSRFPENLDDAGWHYGGPPVEDVKRLVSYWKEGYDWRKHERKINETLPQFTVDIALEDFGTLNIHFVHKRSEIVDAIPLLFVHGWPGSFIEVSKVLPLLTSSGENHPSFHVVAFSLPGYAFSQGCKSRGFSVNHYAQVGHELMQILGYTQYVTQGGDWGYFITRKIAQLYGGWYCRAAHTNMFLGEPPRLLKNPILYLMNLLTPYTPAELAGLHRSAKFRTHGSAYFNLQATKPQSIAYALADSPVGLLAWIHEKLVSWTDDYPWTDDEILTWVSIYWFSRAGPADTLRIYYEATHGGGLSTLSDLGTPPDVAVGISVFPKELAQPPKSWVRTIVPNLVFWNRRSSGGHFAAYEKPAELVDDLRTMFGRGGPAFGVVKGHTGY